MRAKNHAALLTMALTMTACQPEVVPQPGKDAGDKEQTAVEVTSENGMLSVNPGIIDMCRHPDGIISSKVNWNAASEGREGVEVWLQGKDEKEAKLWSADGPTANSTTGKWLQDGHFVILLDGASKTELARVKITSRPCEG